MRLLDPNTVRYDDERVRTAERNIRTTILEVFRENPPEYRSHRFHELYERPTISGFGDPQREEARNQNAFSKGVPRTVIVLEGLIANVAERTNAAPAQPPATARVRPQGASGKVFIVHGRREGPREAVARFTGQLGYTPVILQEHANEGRTVIEKFEDHSDAVAFAVVLFTAEDRGGLIDADPSTYTPRARQNVILELGYFIGTLTRSRVCVLHEHGVEIPSDFHAVVYVSLDSGGAWKLLLAKEMKAAGLNVDLNRALS